MTLAKRLFSLFSALTTVSESSPEASRASNPAGIADSKFRYSYPDNPFRHTSAVRSSSERPIRPPSAQSAVSPAYPLTYGNAGGKHPRGEAGGWGDRRLDPLLRSVDCESTAADSQASSADRLTGKDDGPGCERTPSTRVAGRMSKKGDGHGYMLGCEDEQRCWQRGRDERQRGVGIA